MSCGTDRSDAGFSLIEVLVAIAVLGVVLAAVGAEIGTTVKGIRSVDRRLPLLETAQSLLASLPQRNALKPGTQTGGSGAYRWQIDVAALAVNMPRTATFATTTSSTAAETTPKWTPLAITVRVQGSDGGPPVRLDTVRLVPTGQGAQGAQGGQGAQQAGQGQ